MKDLSQTLCGVIQTLTSLVSLLVQEGLVTYLELMWLQDFFMKTMSNKSTELTSFAWKATKAYLMVNSARYGVPLTTATDLVSFYYNQLLYRKPSKHIRIR